MLTLCYAFHVLIYLKQPYVVGTIIMVSILPESEAQGDWDHTTTKKRVKIQIHVYQILVLFPL